MKRLIGILVIVLSVSAAVWAGKFWFDNLRGIGPAINPAPKLFQKNTKQPITSGTTDPKQPANTTGLPLTIPTGFSISFFARDLANPRVLAWDPKGTLVVSIPSQGSVIALPDANRDGESDQSITIMSGLHRPHGLAFHDGKLYIAETDQVATYDYDSETHKAGNKKKLFDLPAGGNHFSRTIGFGPDGRLYVTIGSSCNVCVENDLRRATMLVANADGTDLKEYATGLRNSVFFIWHPVTKKLWATDMGRDLLGDNIPPEEINIIEEGKNFGWPYCWGNRMHDDNFDPKKTKSCDTTTLPHITFQAHSAPLGLAFIPESWPVDYRGDLLVAYHGSWNRSQPTGYKVVRFDLDEKGNSIGESDFLSGFFDGNSALGRPVDLLFDPQGNLYISDDKTGVIYRAANM